MSCAFDAEAVIGVGQHFVTKLVDPQSSELSVLLMQYLVAVRSRNQLAAASMMTALPLRPISTEPRKRENASRVMSTPNR